MNIVFPSLSYQNKLDPMWEEEFAEATKRGFGTALFDSESGKVTRNTSRGGCFLYRGWMLTPLEYLRLEEALPLFVTQEMYLSSHLTNRWYPAVAEETMPSRCLHAPLSLDFSSRQKYFVKGEFKSFGEESVISCVEDLGLLTARHDVRNGDYLFVRDYVDLLPGSERRYFVFNQGESQSLYGDALPENISRLLPKMQPRWFYTVDVAITQSQHMTPIIVEIGDGQVSDLKEWDLETLYDTVISKLIPN